jgi:hypothetical protein
MSDPSDFADGVAALLTGDAIFAAAIALLIGADVSNVLRSNLPMQQIPDNLLPCFVIEQGDGGDAATTNDGAFSQTIGLTQKTFGSALHVGVLWVDRDRDNAAHTRAKLPALFAQLFMRNPQPGGIDYATLTGWQPDRGVNHPRQVWRADVGGEYTIPKS